MIPYMKRYIAAHPIYRPVIGIEMEFYLLGMARAAVLHEINTIITANNIRAKLVAEETLEQYELRTECYHDVTVLLYDVARCKTLIQEYAKKHAVQVLFTAKPFHTLAGNGIHVNINLLDREDNNLFTQDKYLLAAIAGMCTFMKMHMIYFAPLAESYQRYHYFDFYTPRVISWGMNNRTAALRIPDRLYNIRIEHRVAGSDSSLHDVIYAVLYAAVYGIVNNLRAPQCIYGVSSDKQYKAEKLPTTIEQAKFYHNELKKSLT